MKQRITLIQRNYLLCCAVGLSLTIICLQVFTVGQQSLPIISKETKVSMDDSSHHLTLLNKVIINCDGIIQQNKKVVEFYKTWKYDFGFIEDILFESSNRRSESVEEEEFPIAYGLIVYTEITQVLFLLSSIYHPQNLYCISVDGKASKKFLAIVQYLSRCYSNVHVSIGPKMKWGSPKIVEGLHGCLEWLTVQNHSWKYYQYLSGFDAPLKTNLEMVRIFKALNGTINTEILPPKRHQLKNVNPSETPFPLLKSSMSAIVPRHAAKTIIEGEKTRTHLSFLSKLHISDEHYWATLLHNPSTQKVDKSVDGREYISFRNSSLLISPNFSNLDTESENALHPSWNPKRNYISRYQKWSSSTKACKGYYRNGSCVFGVLFLKDLLRRPELVAHKFYADYQPAAYFCLLKEIHYRSQQPSNFSAIKYTKLPMTELGLGTPYSELSFPNYVI